MTQLLLNEDDLHLVVRYSLDSEETMTEAVVNAFLAANVDIFDRPTRLADWIEPDVIETLQWSPDRSLYVCASIWDHRVVMTPGEVRIYTPPAVR